MTDAVERLVNLAMYLADISQPVTAEQIRVDVYGYPSDQRDDAFIRMFERDKDDLRSMGFSIESDENSRYRLSRAETFAAEVDLTPDELAAVRVSAAALLDDPSFPHRDDLRLALAKLSPEASPFAPAAARMADEDPKRQGALAAELTRAATARKTVAFEYTNSRGVRAPHEVEPYGLFVFDGRWYLVGRDTALAEQRTYAVARMENVAVNAAAPKTPDYERPEDFDVARFVRLPFQYGAPEAAFDARLRFDASDAWRARTLAGGAGRLAEQPDGSVEWMVPARDAARLARFVIENGPGLMILGPPEALSHYERGIEKAVGLHA